MERNCKYLKVKYMKNKLLYILTIIISLFTGIIGTILAIYYIPEKEKIIEVEKQIEQVVITESDTIAPSVNLIYDAVVTVSNYTNSSSASSLGTGFVYKTDDEYGYILTNNHVVSGAKKIKVTNTENITIEATLLGSDEYVDLAVLRVDKSFVLQVAKLGDSTKLEIGDTVFAIGTPISIAYANSVTKGIISGINRTVAVTLESGSDFMMEVMQTNAAINPGNSGGPLVNIEGEVVGINTLKLVKDEIEGMGFSIPIEMASSVLDRLENGEEIERPLLGVSLLDANNKYSLYRYEIYLDKNYENGVVVVDIERNSTAEKAGLSIKDVILKVDGVEIKDTVHFKYILYKYSIGDTIEITYERDGVENVVRIKLENSL